MMQRFKKGFSLTDLTYLILFIITAIFIFLNCNHAKCWFDEYYSLYIITHSYKEIWSITAIDVHPPLYYWILKLLTNIFGNSLVLIHFLSSIPLLLTFFLTRFTISKLLGHKVAILFYSITLLHGFSQYTVSDIRMYGWAAFFVLSSFIFGWQYIKEKSLSSLVLLTIVSVSAAYTHYYALMAIFYIYLFLIVYSFLRDKKASLCIAISSILAFLIYMPWLLNMISQINMVTDSYWISGIPYTHIPRALNLFHEYVPVGGIFTLLFICYVSYTVIRNKEYRKLLLPITLGVLFLMPILTGIIISLTIQPIFIARYVYCSILLFILAIAVLLSCLNYKKKYNLALLVIIFAGMLYTSVERLVIKVKTSNDIDNSVHAISDYLEQYVNDSTAFIYNHANPTTDLPLWPIVFTDANHVAKRAGKASELQIIDLIPHDHIDSYEILPDRYKYLILVKHQNTPFLSGSADSLELSRYYDIQHKLDNGERTIYRLTRKGNTDSLHGIE